MGLTRRSAAVDYRRKSILAWQDRFRDPALTVLLVMELCLVFLAAPLAAGQVPLARPIVQTMALVVVVIVVMLSQRRGAIVAILLGLAATFASLSLGSEWSPVAASVLRHGGNILTFSALTWVVSHAVYAPGRITFHRLQGAVVVYLNLAIIFTSAFTLIWEMNPAAFTGLPALAGGPGDLATMIYFSLTNLTTTGYGDIVPVDPFARSLANLESVIGPFYLAVTVARLVTLEFEDRRRRAPIVNPTPLPYDSHFSTQSIVPLTTGVPDVATFCPFPGCCDPDRHQYRRGKISVCLHSICPILPAGL